MSVDELYLTKELDQQAVSIKAGNVFPITYGLVANVSLRIHGLPIIVSNF